jgi:hypothetical protein
VHDSVLVRGVQRLGDLAAEPPQEALFAKSTFVASSGCVKSSPVSMSPTTTDGLPPLIALASGARICTMSP